MKNKLKVWQVKEARRRCWNGESAWAVAKDMKTTYGPVYMAVRGTTWSSIAEPPPVPAGVMKKNVKKRAGAPRKCRNCHKQYRRQGTTDRCAACYSYLKRHGVDKPSDWKNGVHLRIPIGDKQMAGLYQRYQRGESVQSLCAGIEGLRPETLRRRFREAGYRLRNHAGTSQKMTAALAVQARQLVYVDKMKISEVAKLLNLNYMTVYSAVKGRTWAAAGGPLPEVYGHGQPCRKCGILTTRPSGICAFCR